MSGAPLISMNLITHFPLRTAHTEGVPLSRILPRQMSWDLAVVVLIGESEAVVIKNRGASLANVFVPPSLW